MAGSGEESGEEAGGEDHRNCMLGGWMSGCWCISILQAMAWIVEIDAGVAARFFLAWLRAAYCVLLAVLEYDMRSQR